jgi:hypothetical protein
MHSFLRAIGFSDGHINEYEMNILLDEICRQYDHMVSVMGNQADSAFLEISRSFGEGIGITVCGQMDGRGFHRVNYFPYLKGNGVTSEENIAVQPRSDGESYVGICDDGRVGVSLIFAVQNPGDYRRELRFHRLDKNVITTTLSGLSPEGSILLPVYRQEEKESEQHHYRETRSRTMAAAKNGDESAIQLLTLQDMDLYSMLQRRIGTEDVFSIVESRFLPYGMECDQYRILGEIISLREILNTHTGEKLYRMKINCSDLIFDICINRSDLFGEPAEGRRFRGRIWLQGNINFRRKAGVL